MRNSHSKNNLTYLKQRLTENGGKWMGFKIGRDDNIMVRIRRTSRRNFYLIVDRYINENKIVVHDPYKRNNENIKGVAIRFNKDSFSLEPTLKP